MTEYYLADRQSENRSKARKLSKADHSPAESQNVKVTLLGDFLFPSGEPKGCDPYNSTQGKTSRETFRNWRTRR
jgi:hypothetical protein